MYVLNFTFTFKIEAYKKNIFGYKNFKLLFEINLIIPNPSMKLSKIRYI